MKTQEEIDHSWLWHKEMSGKLLHAKAALSLEKRPGYPLDRRLGRAPELILMLLKREKSFPCWESNPGRPSRSPSLYWLSYPNCVCIYCHVYERLQMGFGLVIGFTELLEKVTRSNYSAIAKFTLYDSLQHTLSLLSLLYHHQLSPGNGFQHHTFPGLRVHAFTGPTVSQLTKL
jgi:hypothetical protein